MLVNDKYNTYQSLTIVSFPPLKPQFAIPSNEPNKPSCVVCVELIADANF